MPVERGEKGNHQREIKGISIFLVYIVYFEGFVLFNFTLNKCAKS